jgi:hypothetical protein
MRILALVVSAALFAAAADAQPVRRFVEPTIERNATAAPRIAPDIASENSGAAFVIAVVGNAPGGFGTHFRSEVVISNNLQRAQRLEIFYFPANAGSCAQFQRRTMTMDSYSWYVWPDFVGSVFSAQGLGSVIVFAADAAGNVDHSAEIDGFSRIWTPTAGLAGGTASQSFPPVEVSGGSGMHTAFGLRADAGFRTNVAIFNYLPSFGTTPRVFDIYLGGVTGEERTMTVTVPPCSMVLQAIPAANYGALLVEFRPRDSQAGWFAFASSVDNVSGDNWSSSARP